MLFVMRAIGLRLGLRIRTGLNSVKAGVQRCGVSGTGLCG